MGGGSAVRRAGALIAAIAAFSALVPAAHAGSGAGPRETVDQAFTTTMPNSPTGLEFNGRYHAEGADDQPPPYLRRMVFYPPKGMRYDTSAPDHCTASDGELQTNGPAACPAASRLGGGTTEGIFQQPFAHAFDVDHFFHKLHIFNNTDEQILLVESEGYTVVRGRFQPDGSLEFTPTTCFPAPPSGDCPDDYIIQLGSYTFMPAYTTTVNGRLKSYATTPPKCPRRGFWRTRMHFEWADGAQDDVTNTQPCKRPHKRKRHRAA